MTSSYPATWQLVQAHGLLSVTMPRIASTVGIGRANLYKYFPDIEAILLAGHQQHVTEHVKQLEQVGSQPGAPSNESWPFCCISHASATNAVSTAPRSLWR
jgi:AcrR family transcriptional regulator